MLMSAAWSEVVAVKTLKASTAFILLRQQHGQKSWPLRREVQTIV
jgi:hypothetical protein